MKPFIRTLFIISALSISSCGNNKGISEEETAQAKTPVEICQISIGSIHDDLLFFGTSVYLKRNMVTAPIPAFVAKVTIKLGDKVNKGELLYILQSKESRAIGNGYLGRDTSLLGFGMIKVLAPASGIISTLDKQQTGDYVLEGTQLCTIAESNDLAFQVNVPFELTQFTKAGSNCTLILPDNSVHEGFFIKALTAMNINAQTQTILARGRENLLLPENLIIKVSVRKGNSATAQLLPKTAILTDEMMVDYWVMKLINDSVAIKIPITIGNKNQDKIEVVNPHFNTSDKIICIGNYGLPDTALVKIIKQ
ncbi:MAG: HlyD family efflux transporter periplasmic adaptor subunit [Bacteroidia bacterium]|nr:HlyD family efflux transporter periplasmic adaptor subunit [Bacteroidia bacterium]